MGSNFATINPIGGPMTLGSGTSALVLGSVLYVGAKNLEVFDLAHQGRLFSVGTTEVLNVDGVPAGSYEFVFGVDLNPGGGLDFDQLHEDRVVVQVN